MTPVAACILLLLDQSASWELQADATRRALLHPNVVEVTSNQPAAIAVMSWSGDVITPWVVVSSQASAYAAGGRVGPYPADTSRRPLSGALAHAAGLFAAAPAVGIDCRRKVIDVSGLDPGPGEPLREAFGLVQTIEVNAIVLGSVDPWRDYIPGFIVPVDEDVYRQALIGKLLRELKPDYEHREVEYQPRFVAAWLPRDDPLLVDGPWIASGSVPSDDVPAPGGLLLLLLGVTWLLLICGLERRTATSTQLSGKIS